MTVTDDLSALEKKPFADAVVKFEELLAQGGRAFLIGAGCSKCAGLPLTTQLTENVLSTSALDTTTKGIFAAWGWPYFSQPICGDDRSLFSPTPSPLVPRQRAQSANSLGKWHARQDSNLRPSA